MSRFERWLRNFFIKRGPQFSCLICRGRGTPSWEAPCDLSAHRCWDWPRRQFLQFFSSRKWSEGFRELSQLLNCYFGIAISINDRKVFKNVVACEVVANLLTNEVDEVKTPCFNLPWPSSLWRTNRLYPAQNHWIGIVTESPHRSHEIPSLSSSHKSEAFQNSQRCSRVSFLRTISMDLNNSPLDINCVLLEICVLLLVTTGNSGNWKQTTKAHCVVCIVIETKLNSFTSVENSRASYIWMHTQHTFVIAH